MYWNRTANAKWKNFRSLTRIIPTFVVLLVVLAVAFPAHTYAANTMSASISVNGKRSSTIPYGSTANLSWATSGVTDCVINPGNWTDLQGAKTLNNVTVKQTYKLSCNGQFGTATAYAGYAVAPPTYTDLRSVLMSGVHHTDKNNSLLRLMTFQVNDAEAKFKSGRRDGAKTLLDNSIWMAQRLVQIKQMDQKSATEYAAAVRALESSWTSSPALPDLIPEDTIQTSSPETGTNPNCGGGYPANWCDVPQESVIDSWGMYNRESVSYTAFRVHADFLAGLQTHDMPYWGGAGNAKQWDDNARASGIPVDTTPVRGAIAISEAGAYGHAMYVEQVGMLNGRPAIYVSQYSANLNGEYSEGWRYTSNLVFIHF